MLQRIAAGGHEILETRVDQAVPSAERNPLEPSKPLGVLEKLRSLGR
jgi:hypothetical protein